MSVEGGVKVDHLWKRFRVDRGRRLLRDHLSRSYTRARGSTNDHTWRWVLKDIDFEVEPGESVGIIGANGAGKSTLLKCVSGLMFPYAGSVSTQGQVGALIEVAAGIHSELTGRENITTYGNLLGLGRKQVQDRFDEIVDFAEIEDAVDRQVKFYSSGMKVRLGFAVAAFLEPAILIVDEVLAVGDSSFQQKCLERMRHVLQSGTTLLLVSHDLAAVGASVSRGIWLADGVVQSDGPIEDVLADYRSAIEAQRRGERPHAGRHPRHVGAVRGADRRLPVVAEDCIVRLTVSRPGTRRAHVPRRQRGRGHADLRGDAPGGADRGRDHLRGAPRAPAAAAEALLPLVRRVGHQDQGRGHAVAADRSADPVGPQRMPPVPKAIVRLSPVYVAGTWSRV